MEPRSPAPPTLEQTRRQAADASGGTSSEAIYAAVLCALEEFQATGSVLDFGAGTGTLTRRLVECRRFSEVAAADLMERPDELNINWLRGDLNEPLPAASGLFDTIVAAEVIEHLENPRAMARELYRLLKPGGLAVISTPNNESWRSLLALWRRGHFVAFLDGSYPAHITALVRRDLTRIFQEAGFEPPVYRFKNKGSIPGKPAWTWQQISGGRLRGLRYSDNIVAIARKPGARL